MEMVEQMKETFTLIVKDGVVEVQILDPGGLEWGGTMPRAQSTAQYVYQPFPRVVLNHLLIG
jgi:hypothetical protein